VPDDCRSATVGAELAMLFGLPRSLNRSSETEFPLWKDDTDQPGTFQSVKPKRGPDMSAYRHVGVD